LTRAAAWVKIMRTSTKGDVMIQPWRRGLLQIGTFVVISTLSTPLLWAATYVIDKRHSSVSFKIRHLFSNVEGTFNEFEGSFTYLPGQPDQWKTDATIQAASIDTRVEERDKHLRSKDFLDVAQYPTITFQSTGVTDATETGGTLHGVLTLHGVQQPVALQLTIHGEGHDPWGNVRLGATATTKINRKDFGVVWNKALETGQFLLGDDLDIILEIEGIKKE
jgi:polyisoprenoid-binding protein YceI